MNLLAHIHLYKRHWLAILLITLITFGAAVIFSTVRNTQAYDATLFLSIGAEETDESTSYEEVQAADQFTETVQGWFKNPSFLKKIEKNIVADVALSARKQEKQNLLITFSAQDAASADMTANSVIAELQKEMSQYNQKTGSNFTLALLSVDIEEAGNKILLFSLLGAILGLAFGIALAYLYEFVFGIISFRHQGEEILGKKSDDVLTISKFKKGNTALLEGILAKSPHKRSLFMGIPHRVPKGKNIDVDIETIQLPKDVMRLIKIHKENPVLFVQLGKTKGQELEKIAKLLPEQYILVTLY